MWPVFSQLHVYALAWPCFRAALRSRPAFLPQTDDGSPAVSPVGPVGWPCAQAEPSGRWSAGTPLAASAPCRARRHRRGRWIARAVSRLRILDPSSTAWMIESRGDGRRERRAAAWIARRGVGSAGGGPGRTPRAAPCSPAGSPARPGAVASPGPVAVAPPRPVAFAPPRRDALEDFEFSGRPAAAGEDLRAPRRPAAPHNDKRPRPPSRLPVHPAAARALPPPRRSALGRDSGWWHSSLRPARGAGRRLGGRRRGSPDGAEARRAATRLSGQGGAQRVAAQLAGGAGRGGRRRGSQGGAEARRAEARLAARGGGAASGGAARRAGRRRGGRRRGSRGGAEARRAAPRLAGRGGGAAGGGAARRAGRRRCGRRRGSPGGAGRGERRRGSRGGAETRRAATRLVGRGGGSGVAARLAGRSGGAAGGGAGRQAV
eukprot:tig00021326_g20271.t1